ncbi:hypothetical protein PG616_01010 [Riemerella anatipestifer]|nr:hypothetical protein [Riemerella anatipestifer]
MEVIQFIGTNRLLMLLFLNWNKDYQNNFNPKNPQPTSHGKGSANYYI